MDLDYVKQQRKSTRSSFTKTVNKLQELLSQDNPDIDDMDILLDQLLEKYKSLRCIDEKFLELFQKKGCSQDEYDKEYDAAQEYYEKLSTLKVKCNRLKSKLTSVNTASTVSSSSIVATVSKQKLPEIELVKFDGDPRNWLTFWTQFSKINEDSRIDVRDKFQYLLQSTKPDSVARQIVESFPATEANYEKALNYLKERFGKESVLIQIYVRELLKLVITDKSRINLLTLYDRLQTQLRALESLGLTQDKFAYMLYPLIESSLPTDLIKIWERQRNTSVETGKSDLDLLMDFVKNEVETEFRIKVTHDVLNSEKLSIKKNKYSDSKCFTPTACELFNANNKSSDNFCENSHKFKKFDCVFCDKSHNSEHCKEAFSMSLDCKKDILKKKNACFVCLKRNHRANQCKSKHWCPICKNRHFKILCPNLTSHKIDNISNEDKYENKTSTLNNYVKISDILLQTLIVKIRNGSKQMFIRAVYDTGSMKSYLCEDVAQSMELKCIGETKIKQSLFGGVETPESVYKNYLIELSDIDNKYKCKLEVLSQKRICSEIKQIPSGPWLHELKLHGIKINDLENNHFKVDKEIKLLIGADVAGKLLTGKIVNLKCGITAINTKLGWSVMGKFYPGNVPNYESSASLIISSLLVKDKCISDLWKLDVLGITEPPLSKTKTELQEDTQKYFEETINVNNEGRYEVALPWVLDSSLLPDNKINAEKCILSAKRKLLHSGKFNDYCNVFENWLALGIIEKAPTDKLSNIHFLPHRAVIKENSTTNIRPVFNASSHLPGFPSLNDCLSTGPNLIELIPSILNRFRMNFVGVTADIEKAFLQIAIREKDRDFLRFLWFGGENRDQIEVYRHKRVVFGITCSPYLLAATLKYHLDRVPEKFKNTADILKTSFYVDNCVTSLSSDMEMKKFFLESKMIMASGHFNLRCWNSNISNEIFEEDSFMKEISLLGLIWHTDTDTLSCKVEGDINSIEPITKRKILAIAQQIFDVVGYTAPVMLIPKIILQETWNFKYKWDDILPEDLAKKFKSWREKLHLLSHISIPRWFGLKSTNDEISLHLFCDSSKKAYAACVFIRVENNNEVRISLVHARSRVAPLKHITIPRLELLACSIGARLLSSIIKDLNLTDVNIYCWTDSTTALCWIQRDRNWGTFIHNRVLEIRSLTCHTMWHHISGTLNPADILSRGCSADQLIERKWWEGPDWLYQDKRYWPNSEESPDEDLVNSELRKTIVATFNKNSCENWYYKYFSSYKRIVRMIAWMFRFFSKLRKTQVNYSKDLSVDELEKAEKALIMLIQKESFEGLTDKRLKNLRPFLDPRGLIRTKTNLVYRDDTEDFKCPVILPSNHPVIKLLIMCKHQEFLHAGTSLLMAQLRERYWLLKSRKTIRNCLRGCVKCQRHKSTKCEAVPGILPEDRVREAAVFEIVGTDLAGPLHLKDGQKSYIVLYTCAVYRAVHLELITSLTTEAFLESLRRFIARRGRPSVIYSDNATNFVGANNALSTIDWNFVQSSAAEKRIQWKFNPPSAAWWGGWWERLIQMVKQILRKILGRACLNYEQLSTILCDCERVINSRPLTYVSEDNENVSPLTPEMFLHEISTSGVPDLDDVDRKECLSKRAKHLQKLRDLLRIRFRSEYLGHLRQQSFNNKQIKPISVGDVVLLEDPNKKRTYWNLARVLKLIPGKDGHVRLVLIKTENTELLRPVQRLYRLELDSQTSDKLENSVIKTRSGRIIKSPNRL